MRPSSFSDIGSFRAFCEHSNSSWSMFEPAQQASLRKELFDRRRSKMKKATSLKTKRTSFYLASYIQKVYFWRKFLQANAKKESVSLQKQILLLSKQFLFFATGRNYSSTGASSAGAGAASRAFMLRLIFLSSSLKSTTFAVIS